MVSLPVLKGSWRVCGAADASSEGELEEPLSADRQF